MNATTDTRHLDEPQVELLLLSNIAPSETQVQVERRKTYTEVSLQELATSLRENGGLLHPIVVRPLAALRGLAKYELVAGERRWRAAELAGQEYILARILPLTDEQVLRAQLVENLQRQGLDSLAEARGYRELMDQGLHAEEIAVMIGKSKSWVYSRVQLLALPEAAQQALDSGRLDVSKALLLTRFRAPALQKKALETLLSYGVDWSARRAAESLRDRLTVPLAQAPFPLEDCRQIEVKLARGESAMHTSCAACRWNSANDPELTAQLADEGDASGAVCLERPCYDAKLARWAQERRKQFEAAGRPIIAGEQAARIVERFGELNGYADLSDSPLSEEDFPEPEPEEMDSPEWDAWDRRFQAWKPPTWRELLGEAVKPGDVVLIEHPREKAKLIEALPADKVKAAVKAKGVKLSQHALPETYREPPAGESAQAREKRKQAQREAERERNRAEMRYRTRLLAEIADKWKPPVARIDLELIAGKILGRYGAGDADALKAAGIEIKPIPALRDQDLVRAMVLQLLSESVGSEWSAGHRKPRPLLAYCQRLKIDAKALRAEAGEKATAKKPAKASAKKKSAAAPKKKSAAKAKGKKK